jgi:hypothetical protein
VSKLKADGVGKGYLSLLELRTEHTVVQQGNVRADELYPQMDASNKLMEVYRPMFLCNICG